MIKCTALDSEKWDYGRISFYLGLWATSVGSFNEMMVHFQCKYMLPNGEQGPPLSQKQLMVTKMSGEEEVLAQGRQRMGSPVM